MLRCPGTLCRRTKTTRGLLRGYVPETLDYKGLLYTLMFLFPMGLNASEIKSALLTQGILQHPPDIKTIQFMLCDHRTVLANFVKTDMEETKFSGNV